MADAVQSSRFLTQKKSASLVKAISELGSRHIADGMHKRVYVEGRIKSLNESVFYNVDAIQRAIDKKRKVSFVYYKYDAKGKLVASRDGERYAETPVQLMYTDDEYYLVAWNDKHNGFTNYRVDRMKSIEVSDEPSTRNEETDESHGISVQEIIEELAEEGIEVERKTVYRDIECLRAFGYDILLDGTHRPAEYRLINRRFQDQELFLMADAVQSSRFLTQKKSASLVKAISELGSRHGAKNAAILAVQMLGTGDAAMQQKIIDFKRQMAED